MKLQKTLPATNTMSLPGEYRDIDRGEIHEATFSSSRTVKPTGKGLAYHSQLQQENLWGVFMRLKSSMNDAQNLIDKANDNENIH